uniref:hypothetical protein n=1 Tax=Polaromonas sp. H6N TaxID=1840293 RepID=UPI0015E82B3A|nr:hypothetical protein [Polaromonas sp. H6N]
MGLRAILLIYERILTPTQSGSESPDQVDLDVAKSMLKARHLPADVRAALHASPRLAVRYLDVEIYLEDW